MAGLGLSGLGLRSKPEKWDQWPYTSHIVAAVVLMFDVMKLAEIMFGAIFI